MPTRYVITLLGVILFFGNSVVLGQTSEEVPPPLLTVKLLPAALFNPFSPTAEVGVELRVARRLTLQASYGYVGVFSMDPNSPRQGFRTALEGHFYTRGIRHDNGFFLGGQVMLRQIEANGPLVYERFDGSFEQEFENTTRHDSWYIHGLAGYCFLINRYFSIHLKTTVGARIYRRVDVSDVPDDAELVGSGHQFSFLENNESSGWHALPSLRFSVGLGLVLWR